MGGPWLSEAKERETLSIYRYFGEKDEHGLGGGTNITFTVRDGKQRCKEEVHRFERRLERTTKKTDESVTQSWWNIS